MLPAEFERSYPKLCKLIKKCWSQKKEERPLFDEIVKCMQGEVGVEVRRREEPLIQMYGEEEDAMYHERMGGREDGIGEEEEEEEEGGVGTKVMISKHEMDEVLKEMVSKKAMEEVLEGKERVIEEMREKFRVLEDELEVVKGGRGWGGS